MFYDDTASSCPAHGALGQILDIQKEVQKDRPFFLAFGLSFFLGQSQIIQVLDHLRSSYIILD